MRLRKMQKRPARHFEGTVNNEILHLSFRQVRMPSLQRLHKSAQYYLSECLWPFKYESPLVGLSHIYLIYMILIMKKRSSGKAN